MRVYTHTAKEEATLAADRAKIITEFFPKGNKTVQVRYWMQGQSRETVLSEGVRALKPSFPACRDDSM